MVRIYLKLIALGGAGLLNKLSYFEIKKCRKSMRYIEKCVMGYLGIKLCRLIVWSIVVKSMAFVVNQDKGSVGAVNHHLKGYVLGSHRSATTLSGLVRQSTNR